MYNVQRTMCHTQCSILDAQSSILMYYVHVYIYTYFVQVTRKDVWDFTTFSRAQYGFPFLTKAKYQTPNTKYIKYRETILIFLFLFNEKTVNTQSPNFANVYIIHYTLYLHPSIYT